MNGKQEPIGDGNSFMSEEIVGFIFNKKTIISGRKALINAKLFGCINQNCIPYFRSEAQIMASCDCGPKWTALANAPTLFYIKEDGNIDEKETWKQWEKFGFKRKGA